MGGCTAPRPPPPSPSPANNLSWTGESKGGRSANKFRNPRTIFLYLRTFRNVAIVAIFRPNLFVIFADLKLPKIYTFSTYKWANILKSCGVSSSLFYDKKFCRFSIRGLAYHRNLRISHKQLWICDLRINKKNCGFAMCVLAHLGNSRICDS
jgi:hypothetical protein